MLWVNRIEEWKQSTEQQKGQKADIEVIEDAELIMKGKKDFRSLNAEELEQFYRIQGEEATDRAILKEMIKHNNLDYVFKVDMLDKLEEWDQIPAEYQDINIF